LDGAQGVVKGVLGKLLGTAGESVMSKPLTGIELDNCARAGLAPPSTPTKTSATAARGTSLARLNRLGRERWGSGCEAGANWGIAGMENITEHSTD
jgi:hypothetical protein